MSIIGNPIMAGASGPAATIFVTGLSETDVVKATKGSKTRTGKWSQKANPESISLPSGYTQLEYIEGTGTQYINTGKVNISGVDVTFQGGANGQLVYGAETSSHNRNALLLNNGNYISLCNWDLTLGSIDSEWHTFKVNCNGDGKIIFDDVEKGEIVGNVVVNLATSIFAFNSNGTIRQYFTGKISHFKAYNNSKIALDMYPCIRTSDNAIGMYDFVSNSFFGNAGTGEFSAGKEIPQTIVGWILSPIRELGTWTVTATDGMNTATQDVLVDVITVYEIDMSLTA